MRCEWKDVAGASRAGATFDAVTALEVIEHVADQPGFCGSLGHLTRDWGAVLVSTLSRTPQVSAQLEHVA